MAYRDLKFPAVVSKLGLTSRVDRLFPKAPVFEVDPVIVSRLDTARLPAQGSDTEKARSEAPIAPILFEARWLLGCRPSIFSGVAFDVDSERELNGDCDYLISRDPNQFVVTAPLVAVAEGKHRDVREGFGQCIAAMVAAGTFNDRAGLLIPRVYGAATTGTEWQFMRLADKELVFDSELYFINDPGRLLGVLCHIIEHG